jgi:hypothetical protein
MVAYLSAARLRNIQAERLEWAPIVKCSGIKLELTS